jgi:hypothetical protein
MFACTDLEFTNNQIELLVGCQQLDKNINFNSSCKNMYLKKLLFLFIFKINMQIKTKECPI